MTKRPPSIRAEIQRVLEGKPARRKAEAKKLIADSLPLAAKTLTAILEDDNAPAGARVTAARMAIETMDATKPKAGVKAMSSKEIAAHIRELEDIAAKRAQEEIDPKFADAIFGAPAPAQSKQEAGSKFDAGKARLDLIAPEFLIGTAEILDFGAKKYGERNWEAGMSWSRPFAALMRHMWAWWSGEKLDAETGKSHLWHAACCLMFLMAFEARGVGKDDRPQISG